MKTVGQCYYCHKSAVGHFNRVSQRAIKAAEELFMQEYGFSWDVVKLNDSTGDITFIQSPDFDTADEPTVGDSVRVSRGRFFTQKARGQIYHHKWMMVDIGYDGFDVEASKARSKAWLALDNVNKHKIGYRSYWETQVVPRIKE